MSIARASRIIASVLFLAAGCGDDSTSPTGGAGAGGSGGDAGGPSDGAGPSEGGGGADGGGGAGGGEPGLWTPCPLSSDDDQGREAFCATLDVPVDWEDPEGPTLQFFVKKLPAANQPARGQLWLLNGGPGYSGADYEQLFVAQTVDIYLPDHRGTGRSSRLSCPSAESDFSSSGFQIDDSELPDCVVALEEEWGERLQGFNITNAARDVGELIAATRKPEDVVFIYGASYGSIWANRYLQIYPEQPTGVILDGFAIGSKLDQQGRWMNELGERWMDACAADAFCASKLGADPWQTMTQALNDFDAGSCPGVAALGFDRQALHSFFSYFFYGWYERTLIAPMVYRLARCSDEDVAAYENLVQAFSGGGPVPASQRFFSLLLSAHVTLSELWTVPAPTLEEIEAYDASANVSHFAPATFTRVQPNWPRYTLDAYAGQLAEVDVPILGLHGDLDFIPQSAIQEAAEHFSSQPHQTFVTIPRSQHGTFGAPQTGGGPSCGLQLFSQFLSDPEVELDTSCTEEVEPLDFHVDTGLSTAVFGTPDAFDGTPN